MTTLYKKTPSYALGYNHWLERFFKSRVLHRLRLIKKAELNLIDKGRIWHFGENHSNNSLKAEVYIKDQRFYRALALQGVTGAIGSFFKGYWDCDTMEVLAKILSLNPHAFSTIDTIEIGIGKLTRPILARYDRLLSSQQITMEYPMNTINFDQLKTQFHHTYLDRLAPCFCRTDWNKTDMISCYSEKQLDLICKYFNPSPNDQLLEISSGCEALAFHLAKHYQCNISIVTPSKQHYKTISEWINESNLYGKIQVFLRDYRNLISQFQKIYSFDSYQTIPSSKNPLFAFVYMDTQNGVTGIPNQSGNEHDIDLVTWDLNDSHQT